MKIAVTWKDGRVGRRHDLGQEVVEVDVVLPWTEPRMERLASALYGLARPRLGSKEVEAEVWVSDQDDSTGRGLVKVGGVRVVAECTWACLDEDAVS